MNALEFTVIVSIGSLAAGFLGALTGLGGGIVIVPMLTIFLGVDFHYAAGAALVSVIATSSGAAAAFIREGYTNMRIGMFLEVATTIGALIGATLAARIPVPVISVIFGAVLIHSVYLSSRKQLGRIDVEMSDRLARALKFPSRYPTQQGIKSYGVCNVPLGFGLMWLAGLLSGLLGIGSGAVKVLAMDRAMKIPFKVSTTTSNFMIGVTAAAGAGVYLRNGFVDPAIAMPVLVGVLIGAILGAKVLAGVKTALLRKIFSVAVFILAVEMIYKGLAGKF